MTISIVVDLLRIDFQRTSVWFFQTSTCSSRVTVEVAKFHIGRPVAVDVVVVDLGVHRTICLYQWFTSVLLTLCVLFKVGHFFFTFTSVRLHFRLRYNTFSE